MMIDRYLRYTIDCFSEVQTSVSLVLLIVFCIGTVLLMVFLGVKDGMRWSAGLLLLEYLFLLFSLAFLSRADMIDRQYDFTLFWSYRVIRRGGHELLMTQAIMNLVAFIPVGLLLGCAFSRMTWWKVLLIGLAFSLLIETLQFIFKRGFAEVDDVFHNVVGCIVGYGIYVGIAFIIKRLSKSPLAEKNVMNNKKER